MRNVINTGVYKALLLAGSAGVFAMASPAMAQVSNQSGQGADCEANPQDARCIGNVETPAPSASTGTIVVTGSRIARQDFNSNSPMVTVDEALLQQSSTAALESNLNKLPQFVPAQTPQAGGDIQPTATNTPGAATISLRGIGSNRNLVLVDGRRSTPSNASGVVDISTLPAAAIERVEVISGGASATYGADAIAGVTNFILKKNFQGLELDARLGITQEGDGFEYQLSGIVGTDFPDGRGNVSLALAMNTREASYQRDRAWYAERLTSPDTGGTAFFAQNPGYIVNFGNPPSGTTLNTILQSSTTTTASQNLAAFQLGNILFNPDGTAFQGTNYNTRGLSAGFNTSPLNGYPWKRTAGGYVSYNNLNVYEILPLTRYNAFARGNYEINDWIGMFGQALFSSTTTYTRNEPGPITTGWDVFLPYGTGTYVGSAYPQNNGQVLGTGNPSSVILNGQAYTGGTYGGGSSVGGVFVDATPNNLADNPTNAAFTSVYRTSANAVLAACALGTPTAATTPTGTATTVNVGGCTNNQAVGQFLPAELQAILASRANPNAPWALTSYMPQDRETFTDVLTYNLTAGFEGKIPGMDWTWEAFVNHGESHTFARQTGIYSLERTQTLLSAPAFGAGFNTKGNAESGGFGASTGTCTSGINFFNVPAGGFSNNCLEAISADLKNRSKMRQTIAEVNLQGGLFDLPGGQLRFAAGASYRELDYSFLNDTLTTQGRSFLDQALGIYPSGNAFGFIRVKELYGELLVPIIKDVPFIEELNLEIGGRMSNYNTTGTSYTYKILGDWEVTPWLRFRGGYNRAERAPNIGELFLAASQTFAGDNAGDVCSRGNPNTFSANPTRNSGGVTGATAVEAACRVLMLASGNPQAPTTYYAATQSTAGGGFAFPTTVGNPNLIPEKADTWTAGVVIQSPISSGLLSRLRLSVDWYDITIHDAIGVQNPGAISRACFDPAFNPAIVGASYDPVTGTPNAQAYTAINSSQYCGLLNRTQTGNTGNVLTTYSNTGFVHLSGIDTQLDWSYKVGPGMLSLNALFNYQLNFESSALYPQIAPVDYVGTVGTGDNALNPGTFEYRLLTTLGYSVGPWRASLQWQYYPSLEDTGEATTPGGTPNVAPYDAYSLFNLSGNYQVTDDIGLRFGVDNLLNAAPPLGGYNPNIPSGTVCTATTTACSVGNLRGGAYDGRFYDTNGRRFYVGGNVRF